jgi:hypothetical protein
MNCIRPQKQLNSIINTRLDTLFFPSNKVPVAVSFKFRWFAFRPISSEFWRLQWGPSPTVNDKHGQVITSELGF